VIPSKLAHVSGSPVRGGGESGGGGRGVDRPSGFDNDHPRLALAPSCAFAQQSTKPTKGRGKRRKGEEGVRLPVSPLQMLPFRSKLS